MTANKTLGRTFIALACMSAIATFATFAAPAAPATPIKIMILDGESGGTYHNWQKTTPVLKAMLDETGLFQTDVVTAPAAGGDFASFKPDFAAYRAVVFNYDAPDDRWPAPLRASFEKYMMDGGGMISVHAADNAFPGWAAFNEMIGIGAWRGRDERWGPLWYYKDGKLVSDTAPGKSGSHGKRVPFQITQREKHPITDGLPAAWMHQGDELYATLRGAGKNMKVLATAYSDPTNSGTGRDEPMLMVVQYGKGRVFHTTLGHDINGISSVDFVVTYQRGTEWAATGAVTQKVPASFPTANTVSVRSDFAAQDAGYKNGLDPLDAARNNAANGARGR